MLITADHDVASGYFGSTPSLVDDGTPTCPDAAELAGTGADDHDDGRN